jgi:hypothetical protein
MIRNTVLLPFLLLALSSSPAQWAQTSGPAGGSISVLFVDGSDLYVGTYSAGVFKSTDGGAAWQQKNNTISYQTIVAMAKSGIYLIASGTEGSYRSWDGGDNWTFIAGSQFVGGVSTFAVQGTHMIAGTGYVGVYASTDDGGTWAPSNSGLPLADGETSVSASVTAGSSYLIFGQDFSTSGVFRSTDLGVTWIRADTGIPPGDIIKALFYDGSTLYAAGTDVYRSDNMGVSWRTVETGIPSFAAIQSFATDGTKLFAGGAAGLFSTTLGDSVWTRVTGRVSETGVLSVGASGTSLFAGTNGDGVYRSTGGGGSWSASNPGLLARNMSGLLTDGATLYGNGQSMFKTTDEGSAWNEVRGTLGDSAIAPRMVYAGGDTLLAQDGSMYNRLTRSVDAGATWTEVWPELYNIGMVQNIVRTASGYWTASGAIYHSTDGGVSWSSVDSSSTAPWILFSVERLNGSIFAFGQKVYRSTNDGSTWEDVTPPVTIQVDAMTAVGAVLYAGDRFAAEIYRSTDGGDNWFPVPSPVPGGTIDQLCGSGAALIACSDFTGIFRTTNDGSSWLDITPGLPGLQPAYRVAVHNGYLFAGTGGNSVWKRPMSDITAVGVDPSGVPERTALAQNYPNPFNPATTVTWTVAAAGKVSVKVYDLLGREVATLFDGIAVPGGQSAVWDASGLPGGVYYVRLTSASSTDVRSMALVR